MEISGVPDEIDQISPSPIVIQPNTSTRPVLENKSLGFRVLFLSKKIRIINGNPNNEKACENFKHLYTKIIEELYRLNLSIIRIGVNGALIVLSEDNVKKIYNTFFKTNDFSSESMFEWNFRINKRTNVALQSDKTLIINNIISATTGFVNNAQKALQINYDFNNVVSPDLAFSRDECFMFIHKGIVYKNNIKNI